MKELLIAPVVILMILSFTPRLLNIAESSQEKAVNFADDMNAAIDCATRGIPLEVCSPDLMEHNFDTEINKTIELNSEILEMLAEYNISIDKYQDY